MIISGAQRKVEDYDTADAETMALPLDEGDYNRIFIVYASI